MLLSNQQKYILEILKEFKYLRVRQLHALVQAHYRTQGIKIDERRMEIMLRQMRTGTNYVWLRGDVVSYGDRPYEGRADHLDFRERFLWRNRSAPASLFRRPTEGRYSSLFWLQ